VLLCGSAASQARTQAARTEAVRKQSLSAAKELPQTRCTLGGQEKETFRKGCAGNGENGEKGQPIGGQLDKAATSELVWPQNV